MVRLCVELLWSAAAGVHSFQCGVCPLVCRGVCVCVHSSSEPALLGGTAAPNRHYNWPSLNSAGLALLRALSVSRNLTGTIPGTGTFQPAL